MNNITIEQNVPAKMRDGVTLNADVYRPAGAGQYPVLLTRLPYGKDLILSSVFQSMHLLRAVRAGYVVIIQDCRGTFSSEGQFEYCFHEGKDGYDTVEWAAALPYSTGAVGMFGGSHLGWTQWSAAGLRPPHMKAIAPGQTWTDFSGMRFRGGAFELGDALQWRLQMSMGKLTRELAAKGGSAREMGVGATTRAIVKFLDSLTEDGFREVPLRRLKSLEKVGLADIIGVLLDPGPGNQAPGFRIEHADVDVPSLNLAGWYDVFQQYTLDNFVGARTRGRGTARHSRLLVGPWTHGQVVNAPGMMVGEMNFGTAASGATIDLTGIYLRWFDHWLKGVDNGVEKESPVRLFLTGENHWIDMPDWPLPGATEKRLYLGANGSLDFSAPQGDTGSSYFLYDPADPVPTLAGNVMLALRGVRDQRPLSARPDVLTFTGSPVEQPLMVAGRITADLWVSSSAPDTDFVVRLIDVHPDGYMHNLCDGIMRARYRNSLKQASWLKQGEVEKLKVDLWSMAHVFKPGHRMAVQVTSSSFPRWDRNWNTDEAPGAATSGQSARNTIWHNNDHPSCVVLPVGR
jgi:putative CocE/NonD family hydrolase